MPFLTRITRSAMLVSALLWVMMITVMPVFRPVSCRSCKMALPVQNGWPEGLSEQSNQTIWLIIDHGDVEYQERYLPLIEQQAMRGIISLADYATLSDRVNVRRQRPQRFGTQTGYKQRDGEVFTFVYPIEDVDALDSLRLSVGLDSMHHYLRQVSETLGTPIDIDSGLTWEEIESFGE